MFMHEKVQVGDPVFVHREFSIEGMFGVVEEVKTHSINGELFQGDVSVRLEKSVSDLTRLALLREYIYTPVKDFIPIVRREIEKNQELLNKCQMVLREKEMKE